MRSELLYFAVNGYFPHIFEDISDKNKVREEILTVVGRMANSQGLGYGLGSFHDFLSEGTKKATKKEFIKMLFCSLKYIVIIACIFKKKTFQELKVLEIRKFQEVFACMLQLLAYNCSSIRIIQNKSREIIKVLVQILMS